MTHQATPDFNAELARQATATRVAQALAEEYKQSADQERERAEKLKARSVKRFAAWKVECARADELALANAGLWGRVERAEAELKARTQDYIRLIEEAQTLMRPQGEWEQEIDELRASAAFAVERWKRSEAIRTSAVACGMELAERLDACHDAARAVCLSMSREDNNVTPDTAAALRAMERLLGESHDG